jgi:hypothetical protein
MAAPQRSPSATFAGLTQGRAPNMCQSQNPTSLNSRLGRASRLCCPASSSPPSPTTWAPASVHDDPVRRARARFGRPAGAGRPLTQLRARREWLLPSGCGREPPSRGSWSPREQSGRPGAARRPPHSGEGCSPSPPPSGPACPGSVRVQQDAYRGVCLLTKCPTCTVHSNHGWGRVAHQPNRRTRRQYRACLPTPRFTGSRERRLRSGGRRTMCGRAVCIMPHDAWAHNPSRSQAGRRVSPPRWVEPPAGGGRG